MRHSGAAAPANALTVHRRLQRRSGSLPALAAAWALPGAAAAIVLAGIGESLGLALTGSKDGPVTDLLGEAGLWAAMLGTAVFVSRRYGSSRLSRDYGLVFRSKDLLWGLLTALVAVLVAQLVAVGFDGTRFSGTNDQLLTQQQGHAAGLVVVAFIVALGAPFFEELFFRGYLRTCLQARFGTHGSVWVQAAAFGLAHFGEAKGWGNVSIVVALLLVGAVLGYAAVLTGRLAAGMTAHCLFNLLAVITVL